MASKNRLVKGEIRAHCWSPDRDRTYTFIFFKSRHAISKKTFIFTEFVAAIDDKIVIYDATSDKDPKKWKVLHELKSVRIHTLSLLKGRRLTHTFRTAARHARK